MRPSTSAPPTPPPVRPQPPASPSVSWRPPGEQSAATTEKNGTNGTNGTLTADKPVAQPTDKQADTAKASVDVDKGAESPTTVEPTDPAPAAADPDATSDEEAAKRKRRFLSFGRGR